MRRPTHFPPPSLAELVSDPSFPYYGVEFILRTENRDPVDVLNVLEALYNAQQRRVDDLRVAFR